MSGNKFYNRNPTSQEMPSSEHSSTAAESSSDSGDAEKISTPPSTKQQKRSSPNKNRNNSPTPSKPSSSIKRPREPREKEASKPSSKKSKKPAQDDTKSKAAEVPEAEKSVKKGGPVWNAKSEAAFLKRLLACCEKGKGFSKNLSVFYEAVKKDLDGDYSNDKLYSKFRGLKRKFYVTSGKVKDKGFPGFKNAHEENLYRLSSQIWGNKEEEEEVGTEKAVKEGNARVGKKKKNVVADPRREREEVNMNKNGDLDMASKDQEGEEEEDVDESGGEEGSGFDQGEKNVNVNLSQHDTLKAMKTKKKKEGISHISESVLNRVADSGTQRRTAKVGEDEVSSEDNGGEENDSSEESVESERESVENLSRPLQKGTSEGRRIATTNLPNNEENLGQNALNGTTNRSPCAVTTEQYQMFDQQCKESMRIVNNQMRDILDGFKNEIVNFVNTANREVRRSSNTSRATGFDFSMINGISSGRELPSLSKTEAEMLDQKWQTQQFIEMEAASKHLALLQEEYQLRMAKFRHQ